jgi:Uma2 family endonuclease
MIARDKLLTVEEFWNEYAGQPFELIEGEVISVAPTGGSHGGVTRRVASQLGDYVDDHELGEVYGAETGFYLAPDVMRAADAAYITNEKLAKITDPDKYVPFPPDLAVEVVSPSDMASDIQKKVDLYLKAGTALVWVIYPELQSVVVHYSNRTSITVGRDGILDGGELLPGLKIAVADLFPPKKTQEKSQTSQQE